MNPIIKRIHDRLHKKDQNFLGIFCGQTGSGKSESSIKLAATLDPSFTHNKIVFSVEQFFKLLNSGQLEKGSCIVWEEMGVAADSRSFYSNQNKAVVYCFETFRALNLSVIMNVPGLGMIDSNVRKLCHMYFETVSINRRKKLCTCKVMDMQYNPRIDKIYFKYPTVVVDGEEITVETLKFKQPAPELIEPYKKDKQIYIKKLNLSLEHGIEQEKKNQQLGRKKEIDPYVSDILESHKDLVYKWRGRDNIKVSDICNLFEDIGTVTGERIKSEVLRRI